MSPADESSDAFQLRMEIVDLRKKLKLLDGGGEKSELLSLLQERDDAQHRGHVVHVGRGASEFDLILRTTCIPGIFRRHRLVVA